MSTFAVACIFIVLLLTTALALRAKRYRTQRNLVLILFLMQLATFFISGVAARVVISGSDASLYRHGASDLAVALIPFLLISVTISFSIYLNFLFKKGE